MSYREEIARNWRALVAASLGITAGYNLSLYLTNIFAPHLLEAFGWTKAQFAAVGMTSLMTVVCAPIAGRIIDRLGTRKVATAGVIVMPLVFLAFSLSNGDFRLFLGLCLLQVMLPGMMTTSIVYSRLIAGNFTAARGIALGVMASATALLVAALAQPLSQFIDANGWRAGYRALALLSAVLGLITLFVMPRETRREPVASAPPVGAPRPDLAALLRNPAFRIIIAGMLLCNVTMMTNSTHLKLILLDRRMTSDAATWLISLFGIFVVVGRLVTGLALDRFPVHLAAAGAMAFPALGLAVLASGAEAPWLLGFGAASLGFMMGADGDLMAYLVMRYFGIGAYSSVLGFAGAAVAGSGALGAFLLGMTLEATGSFTPFLTAAALAMAAAVAVFLLLARLSPSPAPQPAAASRS